MANKNIVFIIPTLHRHMELTKSLLTSIESAYKHSEKHFKIHCVIWVNDFPVDLAESEFERNIKNEYGFVTRCLVSSVNLGFTGAVNNAITVSRQITKADWYCVINNDTRLTQDFFIELYKYFRTESVDAFSCRIIRSDGELESMGLRYYPTGLAFPNKNGEISYKDIFLCGTCMFLSDMIIDHMINVYGYVLNPLYFAYAEDLELSLRLREQQYSIGFSNTVNVFHLGSQTAIRGSKKQLYYSYRNLIFTILLHWSPSQILLRIPALFAGQLFTLVVCLSKGYVLLFFKVWLATIRRMPKVFFLKKEFPKQN